MMRLGRPNVGRILLDQKIITEEQLNAALQYQTQARCRLGEALIRLGHCSDVDIARSLATQLEVPFIDLQASPPHPHCLGLLPPSVMRECMALPVRMEGGRLLVAVLDPYDIRVDETIRRATGLSVILGVAPESQLARFLNTHRTRDVWAGSG